MVENLDKSDKFNTEKSFFNFFFPRGKHSGKKWVYHIDKILFYTSLKS